MKKQTIKRYRLGVSRSFPVTHPRKGYRTEFVCKILHSLNLSPGDGDEPYSRCSFECETSCKRMLLDPKLHTIRANYYLWVKRMAEVQAGMAVIELFYWSEKPYRSKQVVFATLDKDSGCGVQKLTCTSSILGLSQCTIGDSIESDFRGVLSKNDGLSLDDFKAWFKGYDLSKPMAIIQFTNFRY